MSCHRSCASPQDYKNGWVFFGPDWSAAESHHFEVGDRPIVLTADGLEANQCIRIEQVFGCGAGDAFLPYVQGCCPLTICMPRATVTITTSGRYRLVAYGDPAPEPSDITVYGRPQFVAPGYGETSMSCCSCGPTPDWTVNTGGTVIAGTFSNPTITGGTINGSTLVGVLLGTSCSGSPVFSGTQLATCADLAAITFPDTLPPSGPAGGDLTGAYPNPMLRPGAPIGVSCSGAVVGVGASIATCADLAAAIPSTLPPSGPAGGDLTGAYPNPALRPGAVVGQSCDGTAMTVGGTFVSCLDLNAAIAACVADANAHSDAADAAQNVAIGTKQGQLFDCTGSPLAAGAQVARCSDIPTGLPPSGVAGGDLAGTYPNPSLRPGAVLGTSCGGATVTVGATIATCADLNNLATTSSGAGAPSAAPTGAVRWYVNTATTPATVYWWNGASWVLTGDGVGGGGGAPSGPAGGDLTGTYPNPTFRPGAVIGVDCGGAPLAIGAAIASCANLSSGLSNVNTTSSGAGAPSAAPTAPVRWYVDTSTTPANTYWWNGASWVLTGDGAGGGSAAPAGTITMWGGSTAPAGWVELNGASTAGFPTLAAIFGANLPDMRGKFPRAWDNGAGFDTGRALLSYQEATSVPYFGGNFGGSAGALMIQPQDGERNWSASGFTPANNPGQSGYPPPTDFIRFRPSNIALMFIVKY